MDDALIVRPIPPYDDLVPVTPTVAAEWMARHGRVMLITKADGSQWRVLEPWEDGSAPDWLIRLADTSDRQDRTREDHNP